MPDTNDHHEEPSPYDPPSRSRLQSPVPPSDDSPSTMPQRTSGLAVAALVLGILSFFTCALTSVPAIICGAIALAETGRPDQRVGGRGMAIAGTVTGIVGMVIVPVPLLIAILLPSLDRARVLANRTVDSTNLSDIYRAMYAYSIRNQDNYPVHIGALIDEGMLTEQRFIHPRNDAATVGPYNTTIDPGPIYPFGDYIFVYNGVWPAPDAPPDAILAFSAAGEDPEGRNVLFGDGHVAWASSPQFRQLIDEENERRRRNGRSPPLDPAEIEALDRAARVP